MESVQRAPRKSANGTDSSTPSTASPTHSHDLPDSGGWSRDVWEPPIKQILLFQLRLNALPLTDVVVPRAERASGRRGDWEGDSLHFVLSGHLIFIAKRFPTPREPASWAGCLDSWASASQMSRYAINMP